MTSGSFYDRATLTNLVDFTVKESTNATVLSASHVFRQIWRKESSPNRRWETYIEASIENPNEITITFQWPPGALLTDKIALNRLSVITESLTGTARYKRKIVAWVGRITTSTDPDGRLLLHFLIPDLPHCFQNKRVALNAQFNDDTQPTCPSGSATYTVQKGDVCVGIANRFSMKVEQLQSANDINPDCTNLNVGQTLCLSGVAEYSVLSGNTCFNISQRFLLTADELAKANVGVDCNTLQVGQKLALPNTSPYQVQNGDTCFTIATRFSLTVEQLQNANQGVSCDALQIGQLLYIPSTTTFIVTTGTTCFQIGNLFNISQEALLTSNPGLQCDQLQVGQALYIPLTEQSICSPTSFTDPITPDTSKPPIVGFWYLSTDSGCVKESQVPPPSPGVATLSCFFDYYSTTQELIAINMKNYSYPCFQSTYFSGGLSYNNYFYRCYCLGNSNTDWNVLISNINENYFQNIVNAGYNSIMLDIEQPVSASNFNTLVQLIKQTTLTSFMYSFQYAEQAFTEDPSKYDFSQIDYGVPSVYGACNTAILCNQLDWWTQKAGFTPPRLVLGIIKGTWDSVQTYTFGQGTVATSSFAGYCEWNYNLNTSPCKTYSECNVPDPC